MLNLVVDELEWAIDCLMEEDDWGNARHTGKAAGIAAAIGARGVMFERLCDEISNAYEILIFGVDYNREDFDLDDEEFEQLIQCISNGENDFEYMLQELKKNSKDETHVDASAAARIGWEEYGVALHEAVQAKVDGDGLRYALMIGFVSGLMFRDPGPRYKDGTILDAIREGYEQDDTERLKWAQTRLSAAHRLSDPGPFMRDTKYKAYMKKKLETMRWIQNFGIHSERRDDDRVAVPNAMMINYALRQQGKQGD